MLFSILQRGNADGFSECFYKMRIRRKVCFFRNRRKAVQEREKYIKTKTEMDSANNTGYKQGWGFYVAATILSDGISATIKKLHQVKYPGAYCKEFMCFGMFFGMLLFIALIVKNKNNIRESGKERKKKSILSGKSTPGFRRFSIPRI